MLKNAIVLMGILVLTACSSAMPKQMPPPQEFYNQLTLNPPKSQCVYKSAVTESEKAQRHEQIQNLKNAIYQNWTPPANTNKNEIIRAYFDISSTCQIMNIHVEGNDTALKHSLIIALQNTKLESLDYQEFKSNSVIFRVR